MTLPSLLSENRELFQFSELNKIKNPFFSIHATSCKFSNIHQLSRCKASHINSVHQKTEWHDNIAYHWENKIIIILEHLEIFIRKTASKSRRCCNNNTRLESQRQNTMLYRRQFLVVAKMLERQHQDNVVTTSSDAVTKKHQIQSF